MITKNIKRLAIKIIGNKKDYFSIKDEDKNAIKEIINYYNSTHQMAFENNELLIKFMMYSLMRCSAKNRGKSLKEIFRIITFEIIKTDTEVLKTFLNSEINLSIWIKKMSDIGIDITDSDYKQTNEQIEYLTPIEKESFLEALKNPFTDDEVYRLIQSWLADIIIGDKSMQDKTHPLNLEKEQIEKLQEKYLTYEK